MNPHDPAWLEAQYNNRARVPEHADHFARWARDSQQVRERARCVLDIPYGASAGQSQAAPRTPEESPCRARRMSTAAVSANTWAPTFSDSPA